MNRAEQVKASLNWEHMNFNELLNEALDTATLYEDNDEGFLSFEYSDGSVCVFNTHGETILAYGCRTE